MDFMMGIKTVFILENIDLMKDCDLKRKKTRVECVLGVTYLLFWIIIIGCKGLTSKDFFVSTKESCSLFITLLRVCHCYSISVGLVVLANSCIIWQIVVTVFKSAMCDPLCLCID